MRDMCNCEKHRRDREDRVEKVRDTFLKEINSFTNLLTTPVDEDGIQFEMDDGSVYGLVVHEVQKPRKVEKPKKAKKTKK